MGQHPGVGIEWAAPLRFQRVDLIQVIRFMRTKQLLPGRLSDVTGWASILVSRSLQMTQDRLESLGTLGVACRDEMIEHSTIRVQADGHGSCSLRGYGKNRGRVLLLNHNKTKALARTTGRRSSITLSARIHVFPIPLGFT